MCFQIELSRNERFSKELDMFLPATENKTEAVIVPGIRLSDLRLISDPKFKLKLCVLNLFYVQIMKDVSPGHLDHKSIF